MREAARAALARLDADLPLDARVGLLPVAQRQIVAICRGLAANARILFMDEPTASLTRHEVELLLAAIRRLQAQGVAVVFVSHRLEEVIEIAERVTVLRDGRKVGTFRAADLDDHRLAQLMTGESIEHKVTARPPAEPAARARGPAGNPRRRIRRRLAHRRRRRDRRAHRAARRRPHRAGAGALRHDAARWRRDRRGRRAGRFRLERSRHRPRHRLRVRGPARARHQPAPAGRRQHRDHRPRPPARPPRHGRPRAAARPRAALDRRAEHPRRRHRGGGAHPLRRQPAARGAREVARHQAEDADPRRPDHRRRHPQQGRHPRSDPRARATTAWRSS